MCVSADAFLCANAQGANAGKVCREDARYIPLTKKTRFQRQGVIAIFTGKKNPNIKPCMRLFPFVFCVLMVVGVYYQVFLGGYWAVNGSDALHVHLSANRIIADSLRNGRLALWNPYFNLGQPVADGFSTLFHPANFLYLLFSPWLAHTIEIIAGLMFTLLGAWFFLRAEGNGVFSSSVGALAYAFAGPVFFLHAYHLGFMAVALLPWSLLVFHLHDHAGNPKWLWLGGLLCVAAVQSLDSDTALYLFAGFAIDRIACVPVAARTRYLYTWFSIFMLSALTGLLNYLPLYEWLRQSSRLEKTYTGILTPSLPNMGAGIFANRWLKDWPYDVFYFYLGPALLWLSGVGAAVLLKKTGYIRRYFLYSALIPCMYAVIRIAHSFFSTPLVSFDTWRSMFVFCFGLAMLSSAGASVLIKDSSVWSSWSFSFGLFTLGCAGASFFYWPGAPQRWVLLIAGAGIIAVSSGRVRRAKALSVCGVWSVLIAATVVPAFGRVAILPSCEWNSAALNLTVQPPFLQCRDFMRNLPFYRRLLSGREGAPGHGRVSLFGWTDNTTALAGLKTMPNYTSLYNRFFEEALRKDGLIKESRIHPYWIRLERADAAVLSAYGVRFLVTPSCSLPNPSVGWIMRADLSWPKHTVWENASYIGRAYFVLGPEVRDGSRVEFLEDDATAVTVRVSAKEGERLVLADLYYPGWKVFVDGTAVADQRYRGCLRSVVLAEGIHSVTWRYCGGVERVGLIGSGCALAALVVFLSRVTLDKGKV